MKILWITNIPLPEASHLMNEKPLPYGGWLITTSRDLSVMDNIELRIAFPKIGVDDLCVVEGEKIRYYAFPNIHPQNNVLIQNNIYLTKILESEKPDIVHIFGTEGAHSLATVNICNDKSIPTIISIQGLISIYSSHLLAGVPLKIQKRYTFRDLIKRDNLLQQQKKMEARGNLEIEALKKVEHVIGRTTWDKACTKIINPKVKYHYCNETLREEFYNHKWDKEKCERYSIFMSQGQNPIKGLHYMLEALPIIIKRYPETILYIGGINALKSDTFKSKLKLSAYAKYCNKLIQKNGLHSHIVFTGILNEKKMCDRYLKSNVFVSPSTIENSPNSLGEAMIMGVPCIASDVGGVADMLTHNVEGYVYQADAPYMLAHYVCEIFGNEDLASNFSERAREHALITHNKDNNTKKIVEIYNDISPNHS